MIQILVSTFKKKYKDIKTNWMFLKSKPMFKNEAIEIIADKIYQGCFVFDKHGMVQTHTQCFAKTALALHIFEIKFFSFYV